MRLKIKKKKPKQNNNDILINGENLSKDHRIMIKYSHFVEAAQTSHSRCHGTLQPLKEI